jgi:hypothetical protein
VKRLLVLALSLALGFTATACSDSTSPGASLAGTYSLQTINGQSLPFVVENSASLYSEVVLSQITLHSNGSYSSVTRYRDTYPGQQPVLVDETATGYWTLTGNQIALTEDGYPNDPSYGTISDNRLTVSEFGYTLVYVR